MQIHSCLPHRARPRLFTPLVAALLVTAGSAPAANLLQGNREVGVSGRVDFATADDTLIDLTLQYGVLVADGLEVGGRLGVQDSDSVSLWNLGGFLEYHFLSDTPLVPFVGVSLDLNLADVKASTDETALGFGLTGGTKYFLSESVALVTALSFDFASEDVFPTDSGAEQTNWDVELGLRFYF